MAILKSKQISTHLSGSYVITGSLETTANISGSATSTGSFGTLMADLVSGSSTSTGSFGTIQTTTGTIPTLIGNTTFRDNLTVTGNLDVSDTIYHTGDSNTKIRFPEADTIAFHTSGDERLRITSDGQISGSATSTATFKNYGGNVSGSSTSTGSFGSLETSGNINSSGRIFESGTSVIDHATAMAIVFGG